MRTNPSSGSILFSTTKGERMSMRVTGGYKDSLDRQVMERVHISDWRGPVRMNRKNDM